MTHHGCRLDPSAVHQLRPQRRPWGQPVAPEQPGWQECGEGEAPPRLGDLLHLERYEGRARHEGLGRHEGTSGQRDGGHRYLLPLDGRGQPDCDGEPISLRGGLPAGLERDWSRRGRMLLVGAAVALGVLAAALVLRCGEAWGETRGGMKGKGTAQPQSAAVDLARQAGMPAWVVARPPASGERFLATPTWQKVEPLILAAASKAGMGTVERLVLTSLIWNESRGRADARGDAGCARGLGQLHLGGVSDGRAPCGDVRLVLPAELRRLPWDAFHDPEVNLEAVVALLRLHGSQRDPWGALAHYAGCQSSEGTCAAAVLGLHGHWIASGLLARVEGRS